MNSQLVFFCVAVSLVQVITGQCCQSINSNQYIAQYAGQGCGCNAAQAISGGGFPVSSLSPNAPNGISVASDIGYDGCLSANGQLPFVGTVGFEGSLPTSGQAGVNYACGDCVGITSQGVASGPSRMPSYSGSCGCGRYY